MENLPAETESGIVDPREALPDFKEPAVFYSENLAERICEEFMLGKSLHQISKLPGMPSYSSLLKWKKDNVCFRDALDGSRSARAEVFEGRALEYGTALPDKDEVPGHRLAFEAAKWAAEVNDPDRYGKRTTVAGDSKNPIRFIVSTGFPEPNEHQRPPELNADGTIKKLVILPEEENFIEKEEG